MGIAISQRGFGLLASGFLALAILGAIGSLIWWADANIETSAGVKRGEANIQAKWDAANEKARAEEAAKGDAAAKKLEASRAKAKIVYRTITQEVEKLVDRVEYRNVCLDADGLRLARCAILGKSPDSCEPDKPLPTTPPADGRNRTGYLALDYGSFRYLPRLR